jgi:hypothetical protein
MNEEIRQRDDLKFEVADGEKWVAGPFHTRDDARTWISANRTRTRLVLQDDIWMTANQVEASYLQKIAMEDLAYLVGSAIAEERRRCLDLTLSMNGRLIDAGNGLLRRATFDDLAKKIREGRSI